jgi:hypothetical protein
VRRPPAPQRLTALAAGSTAAIATVVAGAIAAGIPDVATIGAGVATLGGTLIAGAVHLGKTPTTEEA